MSKKEYPILRYFVVCIVKKGDKEEKKTRAIKVPINESVITHLETIYPTLVRVSHIREMEYLESE